MTKINIKFSIPIILGLAVLVVSAAGMMTALLTEAVNQAEAQTMKVEEQKQYVTDINVHFKTVCISVIIFTYCW